jgi:hypothetical protein
MRDGNITFMQFRRQCLILLSGLVLLCGLVAFAQPAGTAWADTGKKDCNSEKPRFLTLVPWYEYLTLADDHQGGCRITNFDVTTQKDANGNVIKDANGNPVKENHVLGSTSPILLIVLAILDDLIRVAALIALGFIIFGGIRYVTSQGAPEDTKEARQTIINALIGLTIALVAVALVSFIGAKLGST